MAFAITSSAFAAGETIPARHSEDGDDLSPPLKLHDVPTGTKELALVCDDPDAPTPQPWVHWLLYNIPGDVRELGEGLAPTARLGSPPGACQGKNSWKTENVGYRGPAPPPGKPHHYHFKVYALDAVLKLAPGLDKPALLQAIEGHVLGQAELVGIYER